MINDHTVSSTSFYFWKRTWSSISYFRCRFSCFLEYLSMTNIYWSHQSVQSWDDDCISHVWHACVLFKYVLETCVFELSNRNIGWRSIPSGIPSHLEVFFIIVAVQMNKIWSNEQTKWNFSCSLFFLQSDQKDSFFIACLDLINLARKKSMNHFSIVIIGYDHFPWIWKKFI